MDEYVYPANKPKLKSKGDYGVRVAKWGYDANYCTDGQLLFNSNWPIIQIAKMQKIDKEPKLIGSTKYPEITAEKPYVLEEEYDRNIAGVDRKSVYTKAHIRKYSYEDGYDEYGQLITYEFFQCDLYGFTHALGYAPMFFSEQDFNGGDAEHNRVVLTNIDIATDVDYPYISKPSIGKAYSSDYGIKSKAYYASKLPGTGSRRGVGLDTAIQSKQIMAVKTQETLAEEGWEHDEHGQTITDEPSCVYYAPVDSGGKTIIPADQFEYYGYVSNIVAMLRSPEDFIAGGGMGGGGGTSENTNVFDALKLNHGDIYFRSIVFPLPFSDFGTGMTGARLMPADWFYPIAKGNWKKQSLVAVRTPMVSPDNVIVEVI